MRFRSCMAALSGAAALGLAMVGCSEQPVSGFGGSQFGACADYRSQAQAQRAWEQAGRPARADRNSNGVVCESLSSATAPKAKTRDCQRPDKVVQIGLSKTKYPNILDHVEDAIASGWPAVMVINREGATERRNRLLRDYPTKPGMHRDEYPMAMGRGKGPGLEQGNSPSGWKASVRYIPEAENSSSGAVIGIKLRRYCDGTRFSLIGY